MVNLLKLSNHKVMYYISLVTKNLPTVFIKKPSISGPIGDLTGNNFFDIFIGDISS